MATATQIINKAQEYLGVMENPPNSNNVIFNTKYYGRAVSGSWYPWCCVWVWYVFNEAGASKLFYDGGKCAGCTTFMNWAKSKGKFITSGYKPGDVMLYNFDNVNDADHTGICIGTYSGGVVAIEGNTSASTYGSQDNGGCVAEKKRPYGVILGAYRPDYDPEVAPSPSSEYYTGTLPTIDLVKGNSGMQVKYLQQFLNWFGNYGLEVDGSYGNLTVAAVKDFQKSMGIEVDGMFGTESRNTAKKAKKKAKRTYSGNLPTKDLVPGSIGSQVKDLQKFLNWYGNYKLEIDGSYGSLTTYAVKQFQTLEKITVDGMFGSQSRSAAERYKK